MAGSAPRRLGASLATMLVLGLAGTATASTPATGPRPYTPRNGILNLRAILLGGGFRVTTAIPLHGDFARYHHIRVVRSTSLIGPDVPAAVLQRITGTLVRQFQKGGRFTDVAVVGSFDPDAAARAHAALPPSPDVDAADSLDRPMRTEKDLLAFDRERAAQAGAAAEEADGTLVVASEVIDYARGNRFLQLLMLDLGNAILTVRFSYYDKSTGEELGLSVISSDTSSRVIPSAFSTRSPLDGVAEGLVDQVTRRKVGAGQ